MVNIYITYLYIYTHWPLSRTSRRTEWASEEGGRTILYVVSSGRPPYEKLDIFPEKKYHSS